MCAKKEWDKLYTLFLGGDSSRSYGKGRGGIATGCNTIIVPIDEVVASSVKDRNKLIAVLLDHGALPNGLHGCKTSPLSVAMEMEDYAIAHMLLKQGADPSAIGCYRGTSAHHREVIQLKHDLCMLHAQSVQNTCERFDSITILIFRTRERQ